MLRVTTLLDTGWQIEEKPLILSEMLRKIEEYLFLKCRLLVLFQVTTIEIDDFYSI